MKTMIRFLSILVVLAVVSCSGLSYAQTLTLSSVSASSFCSGDNISVSFSASADFGHKNAFTLQLSDAAGNFTKGFKNLGSMIDSTAGTHTITATIPANIAASTHYRVRVIAAVPYTTSANNGSDISVWPLPLLTDFFIRAQNPMIDSTVTISLNDSTTTVGSFSWDFGADATPATATGSGPFTVTYSTDGDKTVTATATSSGGCTKSVTETIHIYGCTSPHIPQDAIIIKEDGSNGDVGKSIWVNPGVNLDFTGVHDTLFVESGATVNSHGVWNLVYLKPGASYVGSVHTTIIAAPEVSTTLGTYETLLECPSLNYDYTDAPPNVIAMGVMASAAELSTIEILSNPTNGLVSVAGIPSAVTNITVHSLLGTELINLKGQQASTLQLDLTKYPAGTYYVRFASRASIITRKVVKQ